MWLPRLRDTLKQSGISVSNSLATRRLSAATQIWTTRHSLSQLNWTGGGNLELETRHSVLESPAGLVEQESDCPGIHVLGCYLVSVLEGDLCE